MAFSPTSALEHPRPHPGDEPALSPQIPDHRNHSSLSSSDPPPDTRRCFVCLVDEPEATLPSDWATPCACSLEGHQECLLAWVADLEAQAKEVKCPVCKSKITVTERWDLAVQLNHFLVRKLSKWSPKILLGFIASGALVSSSVYGVQALDWFAGTDATIAFLFKSEDVSLGQFMRQHIFSRHKPSPTVNILHLSILPFIAPALVLNRLSLGEMVTVPASLIYATLLDTTTEFLSWPPSPGRVAALYPGLRAAYFHLHNILSMKLERIWISRAFEGGNEQHGFTTHEPPPPEPEEGGNLLDFEIDIQIGAVDQDVAGDVNAVRNRVMDGSSPLNFITGALLWPGVCYGAGELLRALLPARLVTRPASGPNTGLLQERWGRSLIGGCLFVVLKDVFFLYVKYRKIMNRPYRKIKNSDRRNLRD
ncbi:hypothetical protein F4809DRAFT_216220 [Biscogniauxia mediterranea]|nr:hypothetical protein F4809DRAFT_216220 [Biscogniauxia mediterranea]